MARHQEKTRGRNAGSHAAAAAEDAGEQIRHAAEEGMEAGSRQFAAMGERAFEAWMRTSNESLRRVLELNAELATWSREQLDDSIDAVRSLAQCRSVGDAYGIQVGLMRSSMEKSMRHANNVFNLAANAMMIGPQAAQQSSQRQERQE